MRTKFLAFFFKPATARPLAALRIGISAVLLLQAAFVCSDFVDWYGKFGVLQGTLSDDLGWGLPQMGSALDFLGRWGLKERPALLFLGSLYLASLAGVLMGFYTRVSSGIAFFLHMLFGEGHVTGYGIDMFSHIALFYGMFLPYGAAWSLDAHFDRERGLPTPGNRLALRVWQIHLSIIYMASGLEKTVGPQWWNGEAIWRSLMLPTYNQLEFGWLASLPWLAALLGWGTLVLEVGYPLFLFPSRTRRWGVIAILGLHAGIALFLGLHLFGLTMAVLTFSIFGVKATPQGENAKAFEPVARPRSVWLGRRGNPAAAESILVPRAPGQLARASEKA